MPLLLLLMLPALFGLEPPTSAQKLELAPLNLDGSKRKFCPSNEYPHDQPPDRVNTTLRLRDLRHEMKRIATLQTDPIDGYIITTDDEHQSEMVHPHDERRRFISGFSGSAGYALVTNDKALLWTDSRYFIQADSQMDCNWDLMPERQALSLTQWLKEEYNDKVARIGADPKLVPAYIWSQWEDELKNTSVQLIAIENNLVDEIWQTNRPTYDSYLAHPLNLSFSGKPWQEKIKHVRDEMLAFNASALIISALDEIAWLFNIRAHDLPNTYVLRAYAIVEFSKIRLYCPRYKLGRSTEIHLKMDDCNNADCVTWVDYQEIFKDLRTFDQLWTSVWLPSSCVYSPGSSHLIYSCISVNKRLIKPSPIIDMRAEKNEVEAKGMRNAHLKDAVAMCDFLAYMEEQMGLQVDGWDELQVVRVVNSFRLEQNDSMGISFDTIVGYGPHGAIPHYEPTNLTNIKIGRDSTLVIDSGGQYRDGTTDLTRTLHFGEPTVEQREAYTRVLIGQIELATMVFPDTLRTDQLDVVARKALWRVGYDYGHGTSHGVGHFLSVHESPINLGYMGYRRSSSPGCNSLTLKPGYFLSNEPGYYKEDDFGVRLENVIEVVQANVSPESEMKFLKFQDVALVPYEPKLIETDMLSFDHRRWLNDYNKRIRDEVGAELMKQLRPKGYSWMMKKTQSIPERNEISRDFLRGLSQASTTTFSVKFVVISVIIYNLNVGVLNC